MLPYAGWQTSCLSGPPSRLDKGTEMDYSPSDFDKQHDAGLKKVLQIAFVKSKGMPKRKSCKHDKHGTCKSCSSKEKPAKD